MAFFKHSSRYHNKQNTAAHRPGIAGWEYAIIPITLLIALVLWDLLVRWQNYPTFLLPSPRDVVERFSDVLSDGTLLYHISITLTEVLEGLALGLTVALFLGYVLAKSPLVERILSPYLVASQAIPIVALAPLLVIWFGTGSLSKVLVCALTLFFPVLINTVVAVRSVPQELDELMRSLGSTRWQRFRLLEIPAALPVLLAGIKVGVTLSVIGAVVGEFVAADRGLGYLINLARGLFDTSLLFVALITLMIVALILYFAVDTLEKRLLSRR